MKKLDATTLHTLKIRLGELPPLQRLRPYDVIAELADTMSEVRSRGYDLDDLVTLLTESGVTLSRNTIRNYLSRARRHRSQAARSDHYSSTPTNNANGRQGSREEGETRPIAAGAPPSQPAARSALELARARARDSTCPAQSDLPTPGSFRIRPDKVD
jgi:hypothetical protein